LSHGGARLHPRAGGLAAVKGIRECLFPPGVSTRVGKVLRETVDFSI